MFLLKLLGKLIKALTSGESPAQISGGFILGMIVGLTPFWSLHNLVVVLLIVLIRVNISMSIFGALLFGAIAYLIDPLFHSFGYWLLVDVAAMNGVWTALANIPVVALFNFNNTVVLGSFIISLLLLFPMYLVTKKAVFLYREKIHARLEKMKIVQAIKKSWFYSVFNKIVNWRD
jgi:uncharacterized protein (TIGR03546 family)